MTNRMVDAWPRRLLTIPAYLVGFVLITSVMPILIPLLGVADGVRLRPFPLLRAAAFGWLYLFLENVGIAAAFFVWVASGAERLVSRRRFLRWNYALQRIWSGALFKGSLAIFGMRVRVEGNAPDGRGRQILFFRHASLPDVILPTALWLVPGYLRVRHVMKNELLWDPCLDIVGRRLPNAFVARDGRTADDLRCVRDLAADLEDGEGVMIFPEGTRFTRAKRERMIERLETKGYGEAAGFARSLIRLLPPHLGGSLALLDSAVGADVVFVAHVGFEATNRAKDFLNGSLIDREIRVRIWRVPASEIPTDGPARERWLKGWWKRMDEWIVTCEKPHDPNEMVEANA